MRILITKNKVKKCLRIQKESFKSMHECPKRSKNFKANLDIEPAKIIKNVDLNTNKY